MDSLSGGDHIQRFVLALLSTGCVLTELAADLIEALPADAYPGEKPANVVVEMLCGTIATALVSADPRDVRRATELIGLAATRTREHLLLACDLSRRIHGDDEGRGRTYG
jgi:hypothetical protein